MTDLTGSMAAVSAAVALSAERDELLRRLADCERSLCAFDTHRSSEYWLHYPTATTEGREASPNQLYLIRKSAAPGRPAHIWTGNDTQCHMASTGGLSMRKYTVVDQLGDRPICQNCINVGASR